MAQRVIPFVIGAAVFVLAACTPPPANEIFVVDTTADTVDANVGDGICADALGACSLRAAVMEGNADANTTEIQLAQGATYTLTIGGSGEDGAASGDLDLTERTYVRSFATSVAQTATIDAAGLDRVIHAQGGDFHFLEGLTITGGDPGADGGAILHTAGLLAIEDSTIAANAAVAGGAISSTAGTLWIEDSTIHSNTATAGGDAIHTSTTARLFQTTLATNTGSGSAVRVEQAGIEVLWSTITADLGTTLDLVDATSTVKHSIIEAPTGCSLTGSAAHSSEFSLYGDASCPAGVGDEQNIGAALTALGDYGGPTRTRVPVSGSPALGTHAPGIGGCGSSMPPDARGEVRPTGYCDTGAVETNGGSIGPDCLHPPVIESGANLRRCDLSDADLAGANLQGAVLFGANLTGADLTNANLGGGTNLNDANLTGADLTGASLGAADLGGATITDADFTGVNDSALVSGGLVGDPAALPADAQIIAGYWLAPGVWLFEAELSGQDLTGVDINGADLFRANLSGAILVDANLAGASGFAPDFTGADLSGADLTGVSLNQGILTDANLANADLTGFSSQRLRSGGITGTPVALPADALLVGGYLVVPNADLRNEDLSGLDLAGAALDDALLQATNLANTDLSGASLANASARNVDLSGADLTNADLTGAELDVANLANADLTNADLTGVADDFIRSGGIVGAPLAAPADVVIVDGYYIAPNANLTAAALVGADLSGANLAGATLTIANLANANLANVDFTGANLRNIANLSNVDLTGADFTDADLKNADLTTADLTGVTWSNTRCPSGVNSSVYNPETCLNDL